MHEQFIGHKAVGLATSTLAAWITLLDLDLLFRVIGSGLACAIATFTLVDLIKRRRTNKDKR